MEQMCITDIAANHDPFALPVYKTSIAVAGHKACCFQTNISSWRGEQHQGQSYGNSLRTRRKRRYIHRVTGWLEGLR
jgi:hypothetical protein